MARGVTEKTGKREWIALHNLSQNTDFTVVLEWLDKTKVKCDNNFLWARDITDGISKDVFQGRSQMITEILKEYNNALDSLKKATPH